MTQVIPSRFTIALIVALLAAVGLMFSMGMGAGEAKAKVSCGTMGNGAGAKNVYKVIKSDNAGVSCRKAKKLLAACASGGKIPAPWKCYVGIKTDLARLEVGGRGKNAWIKQRF